MLLNTGKILNQNMSGDTSQILLEISLHKRDLNLYLGRKKLGYDDSSNMLKIINCLILKYFIVLTNNSLSRTWKLKYIRAKVKTLDVKLTIFGGAMVQSTRDLSSSARDRTRAPCSGSAES